MPAEGDMKSSSQRSLSAKPIDAKHAEIGEEEFSNMKMDLLALEKVIYQAKHKAAEIRQHLGVVEESGNDESGNDHARRATDLPALKAVLTHGLAHADRSLIDRGLSYLDNVRKSKGLLHRETGHMLGGPTTTGRLQDIPHRSAWETAPEYNEQRESVMAAIDALAPSQETEDTRDDNSYQCER